MYEVICGLFKLQIVLVFAQHLVSYVPGKFLRQTTMTLYKDINEIQQGKMVSTHMIWQLCDDFQDTMTYSKKCVNRFLSSVALFYLKQENWQTGIHKNNMVIQSCRSHWKKYPQFRASAGICKCGNILEGKWKWTKVYSKWPRNLFLRLILVQLKVD